MVWQRVPCCYLNLPRVQSPRRFQVYLFRSHVPKCQTRDLRYSSTLSIYLLPSRTLLHVSRSLESVKSVLLLSESWFASLSLIHVSYISSSLGHVPISRISVCGGTLMSWSLSRHWVVHMSHFCGTAYASRYIAVFHKKTHRLTWSASKSTVCRILPFTMAGRQLQSKLHYLEILSSCSKPIWYACIFLDESRLPSLNQKYIEKYKAIKRKQ